MSSRRIAVVGNCNASILANCLRVLRPHDDIRAVHVDQVVRADADAQLGNFDLVLAVANADEFGISSHLAQCKRVLTWPNVVFFGFHPDITYFGIDGRPVRSAMGDYNSHIVASAYAQGLSTRETARLFNRLVYAKLGFFDKYAISRAALLVAAEHCGLDLHEALAGWEQAGVFMYSINHPKLVVLADIAKALLRSADLPFDADLPLLDAVPDHLAHGGIWPVYPEIARAIGVSGSLVFTPPMHGAYDVSFYTLEGFIERTFDIYWADGFLPQHMAEVAGVRFTRDALAA